MNTLSNKHIFDSIYRTSIKCPTCGKTASYRVTKITEQLIPREKLEIVVKCPFCEYHSVKEQEAELNDYSILIKCTFKGLEDMSRRIYLNNNAQVKFYEYTGALIFEFISEDSYLDTVETLVVRATDMLNEIAHNKLDNQSLDCIDTIKRLNECAAKGEMRLEITDPSGYTRVFPAGVTNIKDKEREIINEENAVEYTKINKK